MNGCVPSLLLIAATACTPATPPLPQPAPTATVTALDGATAPTHKAALRRRAKAWREAGVLDRAGDAYRELARTTGDVAMLEAALEVYEESWSSNGLALLHQEAVLEKTFPGSVPPELARKMSRTLENVEKKNTGPSESNEFEAESHATEARRLARTGKRDEAAQRYARAIRLWPQTSWCVEWGQVGELAGLPVYEHDVAVIET